MNRTEYIQQKAAIDEAARKIALDLIREQFPDVEWTPSGQCKLWQNGTLARLHPAYDESAPCGGGMFEVNFLTGSVLYAGADFSKMTTAARIDPDAYTVERGTEAAVIRFEREAYTGSIAFRAIREDEQGAFIKLGSKTVRKSGEGA